MWEDLIIDEIHKHREDYLKEFNYDLHAICQDIRKKQDQSDRSVVSPKPRPAKKVNKTAKQ